MKRIVLAVVVAALALGSQAQAASFFKRAQKAVHCLFVDFDSPFDEYYYCNKDELDPIFDEHRKADMARKKERESRRYSELQTIKEKYQPFGDVAEFLEELKDSAELDTTSLKGEVKTYEIDPAHKKVLDYDSRADPTLYVWNGQVLLRWFGGNRVTKASFDELYEKYAWIDQFGSVRLFGVKR